MNVRSSPGIDPALATVVVLLLVNLAEVAGMVPVRREARAAVRAERALETRADARTLESLLAQQHADLSFLAQAPPFTSLGDGASGGEDPVARRWARLDAEATLLLFLESSPAVARLRVVGEDGRVLAIAERPAGAPQLASPAAPAAADPAWLHAAWPLADGGRLEAWIDPAPLLLAAGPELRLARAPPEDPAGVAEPVTSALWTPRLEGWVQRTAPGAGVAGAVERLAGRYRLTLLLNVALLPLLLVLGGLTFRRVRRLARLESEKRQEARLKELERQVQHSERLASIGRFAAGIAHEINNPLEGMANYAQLLSEDLENGRFTEARKWLPRLREGIDRAAGTVRQVLRFAEPGSRDHQPIDLAEILKRTVDFVRGHPDCRGTVIRLSAPPTLPLVGDARTLGQVVLNLVLNACQAQGEGGEVDVVARSLPEAIDLRVLDRGPGFAPEVAERLFEPFVSLRGSTGLGLAVSRTIVLEHGGTIAAGRRADGPGAELSVSLPRDGGGGGEDR